MANVTTTGNVKGTLIGKVIYAKMKERETNSGKPYEEFSVGMQLSNGSTVFVRNRVFEKSREIKFIADRIALLEDLVQNYKNESRYVRLRLKPDEKTGENKYAKFSTYMNEDGTINFTAEGYLDEIETQIEEDKVKLIFTNMQGESYTRDFSEHSNDLTIIGYVKDIKDKILTVVDGDGEYPVSWNITTTNELAKKMKIGQMYGFVVKFVKGEMIKAEEKAPIDEIFSLVSDFTVSSGGKVEFESDSLQLISGGIISSVKPIKFTTSGSSSVKGTATLTDEFPF